jgi:hypothetical protein
VQHRQAPAGLAAFASAGWLHSRGPRGLALAPHSTCKPSQALAACISGVAGPIVQALAGWPCSTVKPAGCSRGALSGGLVGLPASRSTVKRWLAGWLAGFAAPVLQCKPWLAALAGARSRGLSQALAGCCRRGALRGPGRPPRRPSCPGRSRRGSWPPSPRSCRTRGTPPARSAEWGVAFRVQGSGFRVQGQMERARLMHLLVLVARQVRLQRDLRGGGDNVQGSGSRERAPWIHSRGTGEGLAA